MEDSKESMKSESNNETKESLRGEINLETKSSKDTDESVEEITTGNDKEESKSNPSELETNSCEDKEEYKSSQSNVKVLNGNDEEESKSNPSELETLSCEDKEVNKSSQSNVKVLNGNDEEEFEPNLAQLETKSLEYENNSYRENSILTESEEFIDQKKLSDKVTNVEFIIKNCEEKSLNSCLITRTNANTITSGNLVKDEEEEGKTNNQEEVKTNNQKEVKIIYFNHDTKETGAIKFEVELNQINFNVNDMIQEQVLPIYQLALNGKANDDETYGMEAEDESDGVEAEDESDGMEAEDESDVMASKCVSNGMVSEDELNEMTTLDELNVLVAKGVTNVKATKKMLDLGKYEFKRGGDLNKTFENRPSITDDSEDTLNKEFENQIRLMQSSEEEILSDEFKNRLKLILDTSPVSTRCDESFITIEDNYFKVESKKESEEENTHVMPKFSKYFNKNEDSTCNLISNGSMNKINKKVISECTVATANKQNGKNDLIGKLNPREKAIVNENNISDYLPTIQLTNALPDIENLFNLYDKLYDEAAFSEQFVKFGTNFLKKANCSSKRVD